MIDSLPEIHDESEWHFPAFVLGFIPLLKFSDSWHGTRCLSTTLIPDGFEVLRVALHPWHQDHQAKKPDIWALRALRLPNLPGITSSFFPLGSGGVQHFYFRKAEQKMVDSWFTAINGCNQRLLVIHRRVHPVKARRCSWSNANDKS